MIKPFNPCEGVKDKPLQSAQVIRLGALHLRSVCDTITPDSANTYSIALPSFYFT